MAHMLKKLIFLTHPGGHDGQRPYESHQRLCGVHVQNAEVKVHLPRGCPFFFFFFLKGQAVRQPIKTSKLEFVSQSKRFVYLCHRQANENGPRCTETMVTIRGVPKVGAARGPSK